MTQAQDDIPDNSETMLLVVGVAAAVLGYFMPAVVFKGTGNAVHDLAMVEKLPMLSGLAFLALGAAVATRFIPALSKWAEHATVAAIVLTLAPALYGFIAAIDAWSGLKATILQMAGTRSVRIDPGVGYVPMLVGAAMLAMSLRARTRRLGDATPA